MLAPVVHTAANPNGWQHGLPTLTSGGVTIRELRRDDAPMLLKMLADPAVWLHLSPGPGSLQGFVRFVSWSRRERRAGRYICFGIVPPGETRAVGLLQMWPLESGFGTPEWGFAIGQPYWGVGLFNRAAALFLDFATSTVGVHRLEARAALENVRGQAALRRLGATAEGVLRQCFRLGDTHRDHVLWAILGDEWHSGRSTLDLRDSPRSRLIRPAQFERASDA
jgi:ribosomal-protein-alanine N-acetyltransferase